MVFRRVEGGEIVEVGFDLGTVGHFKADGAEQGLDALQGTGDGMQATPGFTPAGQGHIQGFLGQTGLQGRAADGFAAGVKGTLNLFLGLVDGGTGRLALFRSQFAQPLQQFGDLTTLAQITGLDLFQGIRVLGGSKSRKGFADDLFEILHGLASFEFCYRPGFRVPGRKRHQRCRYCRHQEKGGRSLLFPLA